MVAERLPEWLSDTAFFRMLLPVRVLEWALLLWLFYEKFKLDRWDRARLIAGGIGTSFALDAIGIAAAFVLPGGIWVC